jgi:hypothetical protein
MTHREICLRCLDRHKELVGVSNAAMWAYKVKGSKLTLPLKDFYMHPRFCLYCEYILEHEVSINAE